MCPPPCGSKRRPRENSESYVSKYDVPLLANDKDIIIETRPSRTAGKNYSPFTGMLGDLRYELWKDNTRVRKVLAGSKDYRDGYDSIIMNCPDYGIAFLIREKE